MEIGPNHSRNDRNEPQRHQKTVSFARVITTSSENFVATKSPQQN